MQQFSTILGNRVLWIGVLAWFVAQMLKVILTLILQKSFDVSRFVGSGGMPSSHSAFICSVATAIGFESGFDSPVCAVAICLALIVMVDAAGVRRAAGKQAVVLNKIVSDMIHNSAGWDEEKLKELIGHTPIQVMAGAILGILIGSIFG